MILEKYNLQMFNDGGDDAGNDGTDQEIKNVTMTQDDFDAKFNKAFAKGSKKAIDEYKKSEEFQELMKLKDASATDAEKTKERLAKFDEIEQRARALEQENTQLKNRSKVTDLKDPDQVDWVMFEVMKLVDDKTDFDDALESFKKSKPQHFNTDDDGDGEGESRGQNFRTSSQKRRTNNSKSNADAYLDKRYKSSRYRK